jgi:hypothetical protein
MNDYHLMKVSIGSHIVAKGQSKIGESKTDPMAFSVKIWRGRTPGLALTPRREL